MKNYMILLLSMLAVVAMVSFIAHTLGYLSVGRMAFITFVFFMSFAIYGISIWEKKINGEIQYKVFEYQQLENYKNTAERIKNEMDGYINQHFDELKGIEQFIKTQDHQGLKRFLYEDIKLQEPKDLMNYALLSSLKNLNSNAMKGLFLRKFHEMETLGIRISLNVNESFDNIEMPDIELCRVVGILLDNALEAAKMSENKAITVESELEEASLRFKISNTYDLNVPISKHLRSIGKSTKGEGRGIGLGSLRQILARHSCVRLETEIEKGWVNQILIFTIVSKKQIV